MKKKSLAATGGIVAVLALLTACTGSPVDPPESDAGPAASVDCGDVSLAGLDDDSQRSAFYGLENGLVTNDLIGEVDVNYLQIPALIQATGSGQFTYTMTSLPGVWNAREQGGLDLRAIAYSLAHSGAGLALYVGADSDIDSPADLAGKRVAIASFGSTATTEAQIVFADKYGLDPALEGGDFTWVELDPPTTLNALAQGDIDAAVLWHQGGWIASNDPELRNVAQVDVEFHEISGGNWPIGSAFVVDGVYADDNPECVAAFQQLLADSVEYAEENHTEFGPAIAEQTGVSADFIDFWWQPEHYQYGGVADSTWQGYAQAFYDLAFEYGFLPADVDAAEFTVTPTS